MEEGVVGLDSRVARYAAPRGLPMLRLCSRRRFCLRLLRSTGSRFTSLSMAWI